MSDDDRVTAAPEHGDEARHGLFWVALYLTDLTYGGPQEGGWWDQAGTLVIDPEAYRHLDRGPAGFVDSRDAQAHANAMSARIENLNRDRPPLHSVNSVGVFEVRTFHAQALPTHFPETAPRYE